MATTTTRLGLTKPASADTVNIAQLDTDFDTLDTYIQLYVCTSSTRPTGGSRFTGLEIWETDTGKSYIWTGSVWAQIAVAGATFDSNLTFAASTVLTWNADTNLYRAGANILQTDDDLIIGGDLTIAGVKISNQWDTYTPTWTCSTTNPSIGNGTLTGRWKQIGKTVFYSINIVGGSTTNWGSGTAYSFGLPAASNQATGAPMGLVMIEDVSVVTNRAAWFAWQNGGSSIAVGDTTAGRLSPTNPQTFAVGDQIAITGHYERT